MNETEGISDDVKSNISGQARFLRGHYYFELKKMFDKVPWIDETTEDYYVSNDMDIWTKIEDDFKYAYENLPETQTEVGRANKWAAASYLGKTYLFQNKFPEAKEVFTQVINSGKTSGGLAYALLDNYHYNFNALYENGSESIFAIQMVANDGTNTIANSNQLF